MCGRLIHQDGQHGLLTAGAVDSLGTSQGACHGEAARLTCTEGTGLKGSELLHAQLSQRANQQRGLSIGDGQLLGVHRFTEQSGCTLTLRLGGAQRIESHFGLHGGCGEDRRLRNDQGGSQTGHATGQVHGLLRAGGHQTFTHGTGEHVQQGGLTAAGLTHHANDRAAFTVGSGNATVQVQRQVSQHGRTRRVAHRQVLNRDGGRLSLLRCCALLCRVRSGGGQGRINNLLGATQSGNAVLRLVVGGTHITQRLVAFGSQQQHKNCGVQAQGAVDQAHTNQHSNQRHRNGGDELQRKRRHEGATQSLHGAFTVTLAEGVHGASLCTFTAQTDNDGQAAYQLQNMVGEAVQFSLSFCGLVAGVLTNQNHEHRNKRQGARQHHGAHPVQGRHNDPEDERHNRSGNERSQGLGVVVIQSVQAAGQQHSGRAGTFGGVCATGGEHALEQRGTNLRLRSGGGTLRAHSQQVVGTRADKQGNHGDRNQAGGNGVCIAEEPTEAEQPAAVRLQLRLRGARELNVGAVHVRGAGLFEARVLGGNSGETGVRRAGNNHSQGGAEKHRREGVHGGDDTERAEGFTGVRAQRRAAVSAVIALSFGHLWCLSVLMFVSMTRCVRSTHVLSLVFCCFYLPSV